jgi:ABC-type multidrug transport system fused ATPase/permease subunit
MIIVSFSIAFYEGWQLPLVIFSILPFLLFAALLFGIFANKKK